MLHANLAASVPASGPVSPLGVIDIDGVCEILGVSRTWIEKTIRRYKSFPKPFRIGARRHVKFSDLQNWVEQKAQWPSQAARRVASAVRSNT